MVISVYEYITHVHERQPFSVHTKYHIIFVDWMFCTYFEILSDSDTRHRQNVYKAYIFMCVVILLEGQEPGSL